MYACMHVCMTALEKQRCLAGFMSQGRQLDTIQVRRQVWGILRGNLQRSIPNLSDAQDALDNVYVCLYKL